MSTFDEEYDSDAEYVPDFDMVDLSDFQLTDGGELVGGSWGAMVEHCKDDDITFQFALPIFKVGDSLDITEASKNGFLKLSLNDGDAKHTEFKKWIANLEVWLVDQFVKNHNKWFGHMWEVGGPLEGRPLPPASAIREMYHPIIGDDNIFCTRVHITKGKYDVQCMDSEQNIIDFSKIVNCNVVPLVELKGIFMKPRGYNPDIVLRGLVIVPDESDTSTRADQYCLFHTPENTEQYAYYDYATDDDTASEDGEENSESTEKELDVAIATSPEEPVELAPADAVPAETTESPSPAPSDTPAAVSEAAAPTSASPDDAAAATTVEAAAPMPAPVVQEPNEQKIHELMRATENAKIAAREAEELYQSYINKANSTSVN